MQLSPSKIIVLDRDGVINQDSDAFIKSAEEWRPLDGSIEAIQQLKADGWRVAIATNQSGIKRGYYDRATLSAMHQKMHTLLAPYRIDWISYSPYLGEDNSPARKPAVGMFQAIEQALNISLQGAPMVGDTLADMQAAMAMQMQPYLVKTGKGERTLASQHPLLANIPLYDDLASVVQHLLKEKR
ncbi:D,D-heptose 1,7-bisphosphate phosphatase [Thiosulfatimonas sediminis]|uniref:D,D-heptose 1,7-bisphosphate phosphatase n=1 Tax=Thiosulfatimonas sediminis TaxID=2675054 RepID=A0A6F8PSL5_9GAMM|nr:D-glycero-beta-D-manno-heptose 1,7-bisphosphate 7-phosphatase [Thiosulfatimonas sediminis]BBP44980.1 D,D-heptose 1,7-bisphosphate phosphatase [Thiosulfatimonas sediminis]